MSTKTSERGSARERLLSAASELFYEDGVNSVGIDRVIERAGVAKASLYSSFGSKDELVRSYLRARQEQREQRITEKLAGCGTPRERLLGVFDLLGERFADPSFRGCAFLRASAESRSSDSVRQVCDDSRAWLRALFTDLGREAGVADADQLAGQLMLLYDGALVGAQMDRDATAASTARIVAEAMLDAGIGATRTAAP
jgi:AcrR family transcriptional regulator